MRRTKKIRGATADGSAPSSDKKISAVSEIRLSSVVQQHSVQNRQLLKNIVALLNESSKDKAILKAVMDVKIKEVDKTPDLVEGIFYLKRDSCFDTC